VFRLGSELVIHSGTDKYVFTVEKRDGQDEIGFILNDESWRGMGLAPTFGHHDWNSAWQVLREIFCNAIDEGLDTLYYDMVEDIQGVAGSTRVYIKVNNQMKNAFYTIDRKLLMLGDIKPIHKSEYGDIYDKVGIGDGMQVYHKQVWITQCGLSLYDYGLPNIDITESRTAAEGDCLGELRDIIAHAPVFILKRVFQAVAESVVHAEKDYLKIPVEVSHAQMSSYHSLVYTVGINRMQKKWKEAWYEAHGNGAVAIRSASKEFELVRETGKLPVVVPSYWVDVFNLMGVPTYRTVVHEDKREGREITGQLGRHFMWDKLTEAGLTEDRMPPMIYKFAGEDGKDMFVREGIVYINEKVLGEDSENRLILQGLCQHLCNAETMSRKLEGFLFDTMLKLLS
jgi:hypothetical protein